MSLASKQQIAVFASGSGTNAEKIMRHFQGSAVAEVAIIISNRADAQVLERAKKFNIPTAVIEKESLKNPEQLIKNLQALNIGLIVLAGFLWKIPKLLIQSFPNKIINIHPALLPKYGGKGMYGIQVHEAVKQAGEAKSGITIHFVNEEYDCGAIILQEQCAISENDNPADIAKKVQQLEHKYLVECMEKLLSPSSAA